MAQLKYKRISLKLSGEALSGGAGEPVDFAAVERIAGQIKALHELGAEIGITVGGGNIWRGRSSGDMDRNRADHMGMLATAVNSIALSEALEGMGVKTAVLSSVDMPRFAENYTSRRAKAELSAGTVVIFACGSGLPFLSTDTAAALKAAETGADALLLAKNVDGVYSADPGKNKTAVRYSRVSYDEVIEKQLKATDLTAITFCREQRIPIIAFALKEPGNLIRVVRGEDVGTVID